MEFKIEKKREKKKAGLKMEKIEREKTQNRFTLYIHICNLITCGCCCC